MRWKVRDSRHVYRDKWVSLRSDNCLTSTGVEINPYYVLEYPDLVHVLALDVDSNLVLVRQYRHGLEDISIELPGGCVDETDADVVAAAARELLEETGYVGKHPRLVASLSVDPGRFSNRLHLVLIENVKPASLAQLDPTENIETILVPLPEALRLVTDGGVISASQVGLVLLGLHAAGKFAITISRSD